MERSAAKVTKGIVLTAGSLVTAKLLWDKWEAMHTVESSSANATAWRLLEDLPVQDPLHVTGRSHEEIYPQPILEMSSPDMAGQHITPELADAK